MECLFFSFWLQLLSTGATPKHKKKNRSKKTLFTKQFSIQGGTKTIHKTIVPSTASNMIPYTAWSL